MPDLSIPDIIEAIYDSVADPALWKSVLDSLAKSAEASSALIFTPATPQDAGGLWESINIDQNALSDYAEYYRFIDLWTISTLERGLVAPGSVWTGEQSIDERAFLGSEFYNDFLKPIAVGRLVCAAPAIDRLTCAPETSLSLYRPPGAKAFGHDEAALIRRCLPHLRRAIRLRKALQTGAVGVRDWSMRLLDQLTFAVFLLNGSRRVVYANLAAEGMVSKGDGLAIRHARLYAAGSDDDHRLQAAMTQALRADAAGIDFAISRPSGCAPYLTVVAPLSERAAVDGGAVRAAVYVTDPELASPEIGDRMRAFFRFTFAEARVAQGLLDDRSSTEIAELHRLSVETVRSQIKSLLARTGTSRQGELLNLLHKALALPRREDRR